MVTDQDSSSLGVIKPNLKKNLFAQHYVVFGAFGGVLDKYCHKRGRTTTFKKKIASMTLIPEHVGMQIYVEQIRSYPIRSLIT